jgi:hypothetical protein
MCRRYRAARLCTELGGKPCVSQSVTRRPVRGCCPDPPTPRRHAGVSVSVRDGRSVSISFLTASKMGAMTGPHPHGSQKCRAVRPAVSRPPRDCGAHFRRLISRNCLLPPSRKRQEPRDTRSPPAQAAPCRSRALQASRTQSLVDRVLEQQAHCRRHSGYLRGFLEGSRLPRPCYCYCRCYCYWH